MILLLCASSCFFNLRFVLWHHISLHTHSIPYHYHHHNDICMTKRKLAKNVPIIILPTRLALMPYNAMLDTMTLFACLTPELRFSGSMDLARVTVFVDAPAEIRDHVVFGFCAECIVSRIDLYLSAVSFVHGKQKQMSRISGLYIKKGGYVPTKHIA
jgi:hypothetical protein